MRWEDPSIVARYKEPAEGMDDLDKLLEPFEVHLRNHEVGADKVILKQAINQLRLQDRIEEIQYFIGHIWGSSKPDEIFPKLKKRLIDLEALKTREEQ